MDYYKIFYIFLFLHFLFYDKSLCDATITLLNKCDYTVWPGLLPNAGSPDLGSTGFELSSGGVKSFQAPPGWSGRIWARTRCGLDPISGTWACSTADCGSGQIECNGLGANPPATLAEFTIGSGPGDHDYYDVSLVDGFNIPMVVEAEGGSGSCLTTGCASDLNQHCPNELRVGNNDACKSACGAFGTPEYCCSGEYGAPNRCTPSLYAQMFKTSCPHAYSYAFDDATSTYTCMAADYTITFCPSLTSQQKSSLDSQLPSPTDSNTGSQSGSGSGSGFGTLFGIDTCHEKFCVGGGQFLSNASKIVNVAEKLVIIFIVVSSILHFIIVL
ncbi:unnamed protein product [Amaranthus hypochondriacus]